MKNSVITILSILLIGSVALNLIFAYINDKPDEMIVMKATVDTIENEGGGNYRYEIVTEDGNIWAVFGNGQEKVGDNLIVVFYTSNSTDLTIWEILKYWKI